LLAILAVLAVAGFLYWLNLQAQAADRGVEVVTEGDTGETPDIIPAQLVDAPGSLVGTAGVLRDIAVKETLGRGVVTVDLDGTNAYPVLLGSDMIARNTQLANGQRVTLYGRVYTLNDSIRSAWVAGQAVEQGRESAIPATTSFVLADSVTYN
jgi:hypothetical protein